VYSGGILSGLVRTSPRSLTIAEAHGQDLDVDVLDAVLQRFRTEAERNLSTVRVTLERAL
jgi:hypothetical protein